MAMILYELMESEYPRSSILDKLIFEVKEGKVKPLTRERPQPLIDLFNLMRNIV
jgi:hypothetical protein